MTTIRDQPGQRDEQTSETGRLIDEIAAEIEAGLEAAERAEWSAMIAEVFGAARQRVKSKGRKRGGKK
jgi:hypothetical protein